MTVLSVLTPAAATTQIGAYRQRHVIEPRARFGDPDHLYCGHCNIRVIPRKGGWRHDPDEVHRLARVAYAAVL